MDAPGLGANGVCRATSRIGVSGSAFDSAVSASRATQGEAEAICGSREPAVLGAQRATYPPNFLLRRVGSVIFSKHPVMLRSR